MTSRCCGRPTPNPGQPCPDQGTHEGSAAEGRMELGHDRLAEPVLDVGPFNVLGHVPQPDADAEEEERGGGAGHRLSEE